MEHRVSSPLASAPVLRAAVLLGAMLALAIAVVWTPPPALADDTALGGIAGAYYPLSSTDIRMESETVQAVVYRHFAEYRADFLFVNSGAPQTLQLGFPYEVNPEGESRGGLIGFRAWQDGKPLGVTVGKGSVSYLEYYVHEATFPTGTTMISVSYMASPTVTAGTRLMELMPPEFAAIPGITGWDAKYDYWLHTGAGWAGTIGTAVVRFTMADDFRGYGMEVKAAQVNVDLGSGYLSEPETYVKIGDNTYQWLFENLEPSEADDVQLGFTGLYLWDESVSIPAVMGTVVKMVTSSNPPVTTTNGFDQSWLLLDGSPASGLGLQGQNPWVKLGVQGDTKIGEIRIVPGNNEAPESFAQYGRPKTVKITLSDGSSSTVTLADEPSVQKFPVSGTAEWVQLDVIDSYPGTKSADVYIADVSFGGRPAPVMESFDALIAEATGKPVTTTSSSPATTAPTTTQTTASPGTAPVTTGTTAGEPTGETGGDESNLWPIVLFVVAGLALVAAIVLGVLLLRRRA